MEGRTSAAEEAEGRGAEALQRPGASVLPGEVWGEAVGRVAQSGSGLADIRRGVPSFLLQAKRPAHGVELGRQGQ